jgi:phage shock protein C
MKSNMERTLNITDQELHTTLNEFLEEKEKKTKKSIWNISTIIGLVLVFISAAFVGHTIGTEILGFSSFPLMTTLLKVTPYLGGALLFLIILSMFKKSKSDQVTEKAEQEKVRETYDKLDKFLYNDASRKSKKSQTSGKSFSSFEVADVHKLMRSRTDKKIAGVCGGLAKYLGISSTIIRIIFVAALFLGYGSFFLVYLAMAIVMPKEPVSAMDDFN